MGVRFVGLDPAAPDAAAVRHALPSATIVVDHCPRVQLANQRVTKVRPRVPQETLGRRGRSGDPGWATRRLLLRGRQRLSNRAVARMWNGVIDHDPSGELLAAGIAKQELRGLLSCAARGGVPTDIAPYQ